MPGVEDTTELIPGLTTWVNAVNHFTIVKLHYSADPAKRDPAWKESAKQGMPERGWQREYELSFEAPLGLAVTPEFSANNIRVTKVLPGARILRGWDFGAVSPAVIFGQVDIHGRKLIHDELVIGHVTLDSLVDAVKARTVERFGRGEPCFDAGDPAGEAIQDLGQIRRVLMLHGIMLTTGRSKDSYDDLRKELLRQVLIPNEGLSPALVIHPRCVTLIEALQGAFHYSDRPSQRDPKPVPVHPYKDVVDALRYLNDNLGAASSTHFEQMKQIAQADIVW